MIAGARAALIPGSASSSAAVAVFKSNRAARLAGYKTFYNAPSLIKFVGIGQPESGNREHGERIRRGELAAWYPHSQAADSRKCDATDATASAASNRCVSQL